MWDMSPETIVKLHDSTVNRHIGKIHSSYLDWRVIKFYHPQYDKMVEQPLPFMLFDFK